MGQFKKIYMMVDRDLWADTISKARAGKFDWRLLFADMVRRENQRLTDLIEYQKKYDENQRGELIGKTIRN